MTKAYDPNQKQKSADKTSRIPIKIVPIEEVLKKPDWIRVKAASGNSRFHEIKKILHHAKFDQVVLHQMGLSLNNIFFMPTTIAIAIPPTNKAIIPPGKIKKKGKSLPSPEQEEKDRIAKTRIAINTDR